LNRSSEDWTTPPLIPGEFGEKIVPNRWQENCILQIVDREFQMRASGQLRVLALDVLAAVFPVVAGFGLYFLLRLLAV
jgi:hypothetical protein